MRTSITIMIIAADILDFLFVFLPIALLTHLAFRVGLAQGRSRGGTSLFVGSSTVAFAFLFKVYFDIVFGRTDSFWLFILTFATSAGLILCFIGTIRIYFFLSSAQSRENRLATKKLRIWTTVALVYALLLATYLMLLKGPSYVRFGGVCYVVNQVLLFVMILVVAEFFNMIERPSSFAQARQVRILAAYYLIEPLLWLTFVSLRNDLYLPQVPRLLINIFGAIVSAVIALALLRFVSLYLPVKLRQMRTSYLDTLRVSVLRDLYIIGSGITIFVFVILLVAESFYENLRISTLKSYAELRLSITKLTTAKIYSALGDATSNLQRALDSNNPKLFLTNFQNGAGDINAVGIASENGQINFLRKKLPSISDSLVTSLLNEGLNAARDRSLSLTVNGQDGSQLEVFSLARDTSGTDSARCDFAIIDIQKTFAENELGLNSFAGRFRLISPDFKIVFSPNQEENGLNFENVVLSKNNLETGDLSEKLLALTKSNFDGYEILRGENPEGVGEYYLLIASPLEFQDYKLILVSLERENRVSQLFQPANSLLILAGLLLVGLFGGAMVLIAVSFRWSLRLEKEVQNKIQELRSSEDKYRRIVENPYFGSFIMVDGRLIFSNNRLAGILETGIEQLSGSDLSSFLDDKSLNLLRNIFETIIAGEKSGDKWEVEGKTGSGRRIFLFGYSSIINIGNKRGVQSLVVDSTNEFREKEKMEQFEKLESMATLAAGIAHDFNNILQVVLGSSQLLQHKLSDPSMRKYADNITNVAIRGSDLSKRLLTFSRQKGLEERKVFDVNSIITESLQVFGETFPRTIKIETQSELRYSSYRGRSEPDPTSDF